MNTLGNFVTVIKGLVLRPSLNNAAQQARSKPRVVSFDKNSEKVGPNNNVPKFPEGTRDSLLKQLSAGK